MNNQELFELLKTTFYQDGKLNNRYLHTIGVIEMALTLNHQHHLNIDDKKIILSAGLHDIAKLLPKDEQRKIMETTYPTEFIKLKDFPEVWHGYVASLIAKKTYHIDDQEILDAIKYHTTGKLQMNDLEKLIFLSDYIEKNTRTNDEMLKTRKLAYQNIDQAICKMVENTLNYLEKNEKPIYQTTIDIYHEYLDKGKKDV